MQSKLIISSANCSILIVGDQQYIDKIVKCKFLYTYIPSVVISKKVSKIKYKLEIIKSNKNKINLSNTNSKYEFIKFSEYDIIALCEYLLEKIRLENNIVCIHGACSVIGKTPIIFWGGASGMGKSTLAKSLIKLGGNVVYDEKILININENKIIGGVDFIYKNKDLSDNYATGYTKIDNKINLSELNYPIYIYGFSRDKISFEYKKLEIDRFEWHMFEEMSRKIRGGSRRFFDNSQGIKSIDNSILIKKRINFLLKFKNIFKAYYFSGTQNDLIKLLKLKKLI